MLVKAWKTVSGAEGDLNCGNLMQKVSEEKVISMWPKDSSCDILAMNAAVFCPCPKDSA